MDAWHNWTDTTHAFVIKVNERYFYKYSKNKCMTAWSLAGAKMFLHSDLDRVHAICLAEHRKKKEVKIKIVRLHEPK